MLMNLRLDTAVVTLSLPEPAHQSTDLKALLAVIRTAVLVGGGTVTRVVEKEEAVDD